MPRPTLILIFLGSLILTAVQAHADGFRSRNELDLGFTNNAYLVSDNAKADTYLYALSSNTWNRNSHEIFLRLSYRDYFVEKPNNLLTWKAGDDFKHGRWNWTAAVVGQNYTSGSPGTTDNSYDNIGADVTAETQSSLSSTTDLFYGGGLRFRDYTAMEGRLDHTGFATGRIEHHITPKLLLSGYGEGGLILSSLSDYSRLYFDFGGSADYDLDTRWTWTSEISLGQSYFLTRTVSTPVAAVNRRGKRITNTSTAQERYSNILVSTGALCRQSERFRWGGEINSTTQASLSGLEDYSALTVMGRAIWIF